MGCPLSYPALFSTCNDVVGSARTESSWDRRVIAAVEVLILTERKD
jgi:hypothetical protein